MIWIFAFLLLYGVSTQGDLLGFTAFTARNLQFNCASLVPDSLIHQHLAQSFLCGVPLQEPQALEIFRETSLLHLMVVSGSHLQLLSFFILSIPPKRLQQKFWVHLLLWLGLGSYCLVTGFQAPVVRAFVARLLSSLSRHYSWNWDAGKCHLASGILLLILMPSWILSFSFYLSWLASLGFLLTPLSRVYEKQNLQKQWLESWVSCSLIQAFMAVFFSQFSMLGLVLNALFAPLISMCLFPLSALVVIIPSCAPIADFGWDFLLWFLNQILSLFPSSAMKQSFPATSSWRWVGLWIFLAALHCFFEWLRKHRYQRSYV